MSPYRPHASFNGILLNTRTLGFRSLRGESDYDGWHRRCEALLARMCDFPVVLSVRNSTSSGKMRLSAFGTASKAWIVPLNRGKKHARV